MYRIRGKGWRNPAGVLDLLCGVMKVIFVSVGRESLYFYEKNRFGN